MNNREKCMLQAALDAVSEAADDTFCNKLYDDYQADPDKGQFVSLTEAAKLLGVEL